MATFKGILVLILVAVLLFAGGVIGYELGHWIGYDAGYTAGGAATAASLNKQGKKEAEDAEAARKPSLEPGAAARLRANWCRDCQKEKKP